MAELTRAEAEALLAAAGALDVNGSMFVIFARKYIPDMCRALRYAIDRGDSYELAANEQMVGREAAERERDEARAALATKLSAARESAHAAEARLVVERSALVVEKEAARRAEAEASRLRAELEPVQNAARAYLKRRAPATEAEIVSAALATVAEGG